MTSAAAIRWNEAQSGVELPASRHIVNLESIVRYAGAAGDFTPVHYDPAAAQAGGVDRMYAMGMLGAGWLAALVVRGFGADGVERIRFRFLSRSWLGDELLCTGAIVDRDESRRSVRVALRGTGPDGTPILLGEATVKPIQ